MSLTSGCASSQRVAAIEPPESLLRPCEIPKYTGIGQIGRVQYIVELWAVIDKCNSDKLQIKEFYKSK